MAEKPRIIIGAETEYGIQFTKKGIKQTLHSLDAAFRIVRAVSQLSLDLFERSLEGISDIEEHTAVEVAEIIENESSGNFSEGAVEQRRGLTGHILGNGARFYIDMGHPEYSIPETTNPLDALLAQKAGDKITEICRAIAQESMDPGYSIRLDKNNSDGKGNSYAAHENYSLSREVFQQVILKKHLSDKGEHCSRHGSHYCFCVEYKNSELAQLVMNFFVSRQIITGAGKTGSESGKQVPYQITQRADFMVKAIAGNTTHDRGIINSRDYSYAGQDIARFHVINGDGNLSELSLFLKFGTAGLFFMMLDSGFLEKEAGKLSVSLKNPVRSYRNVSRDLSLRHEIHFSDGRKETALDIQRKFCLLAKSFVERYGLASVWQDVVEKWEGALEGLASQDIAGHEISGNLDWVIKKDIISRYMKKNGIEDPLHHYCRVLDMEYHNTNPEKGIYYKLLRQGHIVRLVTDEQVDKAMTSSPEDTRAWLRSEVLRRYKDKLSLVSWSTIKFINYDMIYMPDPFSANRQQLEHLLQDNPSASEFTARLSASNVPVVVSNREDRRII